jgi:predicted nucleic acid-binding protein
MEARTQKRLALDTNVLFDLADGKDFAHDFRETCRSKGYALLISPTVVAELFFLERHGDMEERRLASRSLARIASWDIQAFTLSSLQLDLSRRLASSILAHRLLPESEVNDAFILAEAAVAAIPLVVSSDQHLLDLDEGALRDECLRADLPTVFPVNPRRLLRALR